MEHSGDILALPPADPSIPPETSEMICPFTLLPELRRRIEPAGHAYRLLYQRIFGKVDKRGKRVKVDEKQKNSSSDSDSSDSEGLEENKFNPEWAKKRKTMSTEERLKESLVKENLYEVLGLQELNMSAGMGDIRTAYYKLALKYHPDKIIEEVKEEVEEVNKEIWLKIQDAYETLIDPQKRKKYDSTLPFDESIPDPQNINDLSFYEMYSYSINI